MRLEPIVMSLLDTDLYKFNMDQVIFHKHTDLCGQYYFKCRNEGVKFTKEMVEEIRKRLNFTTLQFQRLDDLEEAIGIGPCKLCTYCWSGRE